MIYTFYSFQGGVGRSTALAHAAQWLYLQGLSVVIVDWNLQTPGLERFFFAPGADGAETAVSRGLEWVRDQPGVIDMLVDYQQSFGWLPGAAQPAAETAGKSELAPRERMPLAEYLVTIHSTVGLENAAAGRGSLSLLTAGRRSQEHFESYTQTVGDVSWDEFETGLRGIEYIDSLRQELLHAADVVLIDSPAGVGKVGGVCTQLLADVIVCFCAPDDQNVQGTHRMLEHFAIARTVAAREHRPIETIIVPTRIDLVGPDAYGARLVGPDAYGARRSQPDQVREFERRFARLIEKNPPPARLVARGFRPWDLQIPYSAELASRGHRVIGSDSGGAASADRPEAAYATLASCLAELASNSSVAPPTEFEELKSALLEAAEMGHFIFEAPDAPGPAPQAGPTPVPASIAPPKEAIGPRSPLSEPSVPPVANQTVAIRRQRRWGWPVAGLSFLVLAMVSYLLARPQLELALAARAVPPPAPQQEAEKTAPDLGASTTSGAAAQQKGPDQPPALYLRIGLGPSCPKMLNYRKQFRAAGISDAEVAELRTGGCALVLGPYPAEMVERRRIEHNARGIRGFGNALIVDDRDFEKLL